MCQIESRDIGDVSRYPVFIQTPRSHWARAHPKLDHQIQEFDSRISRISRFSRISRISRISEKYIWNHDLCHVIVWNEQTETHAMFSRAGANISGFLDHIFFQDFQEIQEFQESWNSWNSWTQNLLIWFMKSENRHIYHCLSYSRDNRPFRQHISLDLKFSCWFL